MFHALSNLFIFLPTTGFLTLKSLAFLLPLKKKWYQKLILLLSCALLNGMVIFIGDLVNLPPTILFFLVCVLLCCSGSFLPKLTIGFMFASTSFSFNAIVDNYFPIERVYSSVLRVLFWLFIYLLLRHFAPEKEYSLSRSLWKLLLFLTCIPLIIVTAIVLLTDISLTLRPDTQLINFILLLASLLSFLGLLQTITVLAKQQKLERQNTYMNINRRYYETLEQQQFEVRRLKHDMSNHLQTLSSLADAEKNDYISKLLDTPVFTKAIRYCGDAAINAVLSAKMNKLEQSGIHLELKLDIPNELPLEKMDTCSIFANALDNAIEYCHQLPPAKRRINLDAHVKKGLFVLKIKNPYLNSPSLQKNMLPATTKSNVKEHGFGLKSIQEVVNRYDGHFEIQTDSNEFLLFLYLPI